MHIYTSVTCESSWSALRRPTKLAFSTLAAGDRHIAACSRTRNICADIEGTPDVDYIVGSHASMPILDVNNESFDVVLSSQVLEHVDKPTDYLAECFRVLRPKGKLIITTHGTFEDHGCPADYFRWTASGLSLVLRRAGFDVVEAWKLTTGARAALFLIEHHFPWTSRYKPLALCLAPLRRAIFSHRTWWHRQCDTVFKDNRVVPGNSQ